jgi:hypothetical protein
MDCGWTTGLRATAGRESGSVVWDMWEREARDVQGGLPANFPVSGLSLAHVAHLLRRSPQIRPPGNSRRAQRHPDV